MNDALDVDVSVVLGKTRMPIQQLLRLGRGAVVDLDTVDSDVVDILANGRLIARGEVVVTGANISVTVTEMLRKPDLLRTPGYTIGEQFELMTEFGPLSKSG